MTALPRLLLIGPLPPPSGGMANQTRQLARLLQAEGMSVELVQTNAPYRRRGLATCVECGPRSGSCRFC